MVAVGAGHLAGRDSVIAMLQKRGLQGPPGPVIAPLPSAHR